MILGRNVRVWQSTGRQSGQHLSGNHHDGLSATRVPVQKLGPIDDAAVVHKPGSFPGVMCCHLNPHQHCCQRSAVG